MSHGFASESHKMGSVVIAGLRIRAVLMLAVRTAAQKDSAGAVMRFRISSIDKFGQSRQADLLYCLQHVTVNRKGGPGSL